MVVAHGDDKETIVIDGCTIESSSGYAILLHTNSATIRNSVIKSNGEVNWLTPILP